MKIQCLHPEPRTTQFAVKIEKQNELAEDIDARQYALAVPLESVEAIKAARRPLATLGDALSMLDKVKTIDV
jgi:hypothetical protein